MSLAAVSTPEIAPDSWLAQVIGRPAFVLRDGPTAHPVGSLTPGFYTAKVPTDDVERLRSLSALGFYVVDTNVTLTRSARPPERALGTRVEVTEATLDQHAALLDIAGSCFRFSRFHLDPGFSRDDADDVKRAWVRSYIEGRRGASLLAARREGATLGFLAVLEARDERVIDLVGVHPDAQREGVGSALVGAFVDRYRLHTQRVGTQVANVASLRLYAAHGFVVSDSRYVLHRHVTQ